MHNTHLEIAASYGVIVMILVCILLAVYIYRRGHVCQNKQGMSYILGFCGAILVGLGEAALFSGGLGIYIFVGAYLLMGNAFEAQSPSIREKNVS